MNLTRDGERERERGKKERKRKKERGRQTKREGERSAERRHVSNDINKLEKLVFTHSQVTEREIRLCRIVRVGGHQNQSRVRAAAVEVLVNFRPRRLCPPLAGFQLLPQRESLFHVYVSTYRNIRIQFPREFPIEPRSSTVRAILTERFPESWRDSRTRLSLISPRVSDERRRV